MSYSSVIPISLSAWANTIPGLALNSRHSSLNSSTVGGAPFSDSSALTLGCVTPISLAIVRIDKSCISWSFNSRTSCIAALSRFVHCLEVRATNNSIHTITGYCSLTSRLCSAWVITFAGSSCSSRQRLINSSTVGIPCMWSRKSIMRGGLTSIAFATVRSDGASGIVFQVSITMFMSSCANGVHCFPVRAMKVSLMLINSNTPNAKLFDKLLEYSNIRYMLENSNASVGEIAVEYLSAAMKLRNIRQYEMARQLGISRQTLASRLRSRAMSIDDFINLALAIDVDPAEVITSALQARVRS